MDNTQEPQEQTPSTDPQEPTQKPPPSPEELQQEFQKVIQDKFGGQVQVVSMGPTPPTPQPNETEAKEQQDSLAAIRDFNITPKQMVSELDKTVIGQFEAKKSLALAVCDHYKHVQAEAAGEVLTHYQKQNVLLVGPTGVGKTFLIREIAKMVGVPFVKADATRFSETGYMGANVDDVIKELLQKANGNHQLAEQGIVYVDEIDKIANRGPSQQKDVSGRGVQFGFLRLLENADVDLNATNDAASQFKAFMSLQKNGKVEKELINTKNILFIFSGAFSGLEKIIAKRQSPKSIGIQGELAQKDLSSYMKNAAAVDFVKFGFEAEFVGRMPVTSFCEELSQEQLYKILKESESSIIRQHVRSFAQYGIDLKFTDECLNLIAKKAARQKTGARALVFVCEQLLRNFKYELSETTCKELRMTEEAFENPQSYLQYIKSGL